MSELKHHGVPGMKWGVRRYQNYDGTRIGAKHRSGGEKSVVRKAVAKGTNDAPLGKKVHKSLNQRRLERAAKTSYRDADELEKAGYKEEAKAVRKVADNNSSKAKKIEAIRREAEAQQKQLDELRKNGNLSEKDYNRLKNDTPKTLIGLKKDKRIMNEADANSHSKEIEKAKEKLASEKSVVKKDLFKEKVNKANKITDNYTGLKSIEDYRYMLSKGSHSWKQFPTYQKKALNYVKYLNKRRRREKDPVVKDLIDIRIMEYVDDFNLHNEKW